MKRWFDSSIRNKIATVVLVAVIPAILLASVFGAWRETGRRLDFKRTEIKGIASALAATVSEPLASGNQRQVANSLKGAGAIPGVKHVGVLDNSGATVFQFGAGIVVDSGDRGATRQDYRTFLIEVPVVHAGREIGALVLIADTSEVAAEFLRSLSSALLAGFVAALVGFHAAHRMQRTITGPIALLTTAMRDVRETRNFTGSVPGVSGDETGVLVEAFNGMLREINTRDAKLAEYREGLERQVDERTRDLAAATRAAELAKAAKSEFLATMSHEIRTPMNGILVMAELLAADELPPRAQRHCEVILRSGQTLLSIINDILDLSKIEAGHLTLESVALEPAGIVDDVVQLYAERAHSRALELAAYVAPDVPSRILGDPVRLGQVLSNLVNNALKFTETGGVLIRVEMTRDAEPALRISVTDTGIGIAEDKLASIFDPFTQAEQSTTRRYGGTGIGLSICRRLVDAMGGELSVTSKPGGGSTFAFAFRAEPLASSEVPSGSQGPTAAPGGTALLTIAPGPVRTVLGEICREFGLDVVDAATTAVGGGVTADVRVAILSATCVSSDEQGWRQLPVLALSRVGDSTGDALLRRGTVRGVLDLPFDGRDARAAIARILDGRHPSAAAHEARRDPPAGARARFPSVRVLAADDSAINREILIEALSRLGVETTCVGDGAAAIPAVQSGSFDLVFMDGSMPVLDGFEATRAIRAWEADAGRDPIPIVGLSAHVLGAQSDLWRDAGMSDFITKPFTLATIERCLQRWIAPAASTPDGCAGDAAPPPAESTDATLIDTEVLASIGAMQAPGDDLVQRVTSLYCTHAPRLFAELVDCATSSKSTDAWAAAAHALKSLSRNIGAVGVGDLCDAIEVQAREGGGAPTARLSELSVALRDTIAALDDASREAGGSASREAPRPTGAPSTIAATA